MSNFFKTSTVNLIKRHIKLCFVQPLTLIQLNKFNITFFSQCKMTFLYFVCPCNVNTLEQITTSTELSLEKRRLRLHFFIFFNFSVFNGYRATTYRNEIK